MSKRDVSKLSHLLKLCLLQMTYALAGPKCPKRNVPTGPKCPIGTDLRIGVENG